MRAGRHSRLAGAGSTSRFLDLSGWIPDFVLIGTSTTLVEVKPIGDLVDAVAHRACKKAADTVRRSNRTDEILLLGYAWPATETYNGELGLGWLTEWHEHSPGEPLYTDWDVAAFHSLGGLGFHHSSASYRNRITGDYDGCAGTFAPAPLLRGTKPATSRNGGPHHDPVLHLLAAERKNRRSHSAADY